MFIKKLPLNLDKVLSNLILTNQVQTLKASGNQPRAGSLSPNLIALAGGPNLPAHVSEVRAVTTKSNDSTSKVTVTFSRSPNDYQFVDARVFVSGYKGNPAPAQVASGQSPVSFSLENTGEPVTVSVQASGNLGQAALSTAPSTTLQLVKTPLATTPTAAGNGTGGAVALTMPAEFSVAGSGTSSIVVTKATESANTVWAGPTIGSAAQPSFRALNKLDGLPFHSLYGYHSPNQNSGGFTLSGLAAAVVTGNVSIIRGTSTVPMQVEYATGTGASASAGQQFFATGASDFSIDTIAFFEAKVKLTSTANIRVWIGLSDKVTNAGITVMQTDAPNANTIAFRYSSAVDAKWKCVTATSNVAFTATAESGSHLDTSEHTFRIAVTGGNAYFFIDGTLVCTQSTTLPANTALLNSLVVCDNIALTNDKAVRVFYHTVQGI